jgi:Ribbon-helix-helix protein, copG family
MKRTQVYLTEEQDRRLARVATERGTSRAAALRWAIDAALGTGDAEGEARRIILATAGILHDYPAWEEWQRAVRGRTASQRLDTDER